MKICKNLYMLFFSVALFGPEYQAWSLKFLVKKTSVFVIRGGAVWAGIGGTLCSEIVGLSIVWA
ncbi:MAG: hypothetical protein A2W94_05875 [Bacteroidetes bacterium GWE2_42_42]|nr:MAG: hypothetical protein A2W94_05875 [Bacteroidetes bacterium GWE2_42_42]